MTKKVFLVINSGSSSIKYNMFFIDDIQNIDEVLKGSVKNINNAGGATTFDLSFVSDFFNSEQEIEETWEGGVEFDKAITKLMTVIKDLCVKKGIKLSGIGHRVVHGGNFYSAATKVEDEVITNLKSIIQLTPIHLPNSIKAMEIIKDFDASLIQIACFDTAFHQTMPEVAYTYAINKNFAEEKGIRRYGMHGLSYQYLMDFMKNECNYDLKGKRIVACHLGAGASIAAIKDGQSIDTTMGLTPLEGLPMASRSGNLDPGAILFLLKSCGFSAQRLEDFLYFESGILGLTNGKTSNFREVQMTEEEENGDEEGLKAWKVFEYHVLKHAGAMISALGGIDAIVFTGGVGENSSSLRSYMSKNLAYLGTEIDESLNNDTNAIKMHTKASRVEIYRIRTNEELIIAKQSVKFLQ